MDTHDQLFKELLTTFFDDLCGLFLPELSAGVRGDPRWVSGEAILRQVRGGDPERRTRRADLLAAVRMHDGDAQGLVHLEIASYYRSGDPRRMWEYGTLASLNHHLPVVPLLIVLNGGSKAGLVEETFAEELAGWAALPLHYRTVYLEKMEPERFLAQHREPLAAALAALMKGGRWSAPRHKLECSRHLSAAGTLSRRRRDLLVDCITTYLPLNDAEKVEFDKLWRKEMTMALPEMTFSARMKMEGRQEGMKEGMEKGRREGRREGRTEGFRRLLLRQLELRFGALDPEVRRRVEVLDSPDELERLAEQVLTAGSPAEMGLG